MSHTRPAITLCADDYGLAPGVSDAIRALIGMGRLQATGCMTGSAHWPEAAAALKPLDGLADIGLHLTLTDQSPLGPMPALAPAGRLPPLPVLLKLALARRLDTAEIAVELERQIDAFEAAFGRPPDFLDGHHHVHQLPGIGEAVIGLWRRRLGGKGWFRSCVEPRAAIIARGVSPLRALVISELGQGFRRRLKSAGVPHNRSFRGVYDFSGRIPFDRLFERFTDRPGPRTLMMVHPGHVDAALEAADTLTHQREVEYRFLASDDMVRSLARRGLTLARLSP
ncbi:ChbG/HpnK family deacetylase [Magnetospirillum sp. UT-4]|uniref:ChbG/HpnK family deacetylase n=1 Tax=Magnetospirillum sp. UT-4 TaxID=2681467 RepID=UPI001383091F|nr:ChbG/HpnK family deacetylase [Magnetospirillum sp. UT-4]CAA7620395.1 YdjC-like protein [Magnetospirillum sp. UT-4]